MTTRTVPAVPLLARLSVALPSPGERRSENDLDESRNKQTKVTEIRRETTDDC